MFKDYHKYLSTSLKVYLFVLVVIFIMKVVGLDYFGLDINNPIIVKITTWLRYHRIFDILNTADFFNFIILYIQLYFYLRIVCNKEKMYIWAFIGTLINFISQLFLVKFYCLDWVYLIISLLITVFMPIVINNKISFKKQIKYILLINVYQLISLSIRNIGIAKNYNNFIVDYLLNIDQLIMLIINYKIVMMKGDADKWEQEQEVGSSLLKKINLKTLLKRLQRNLHNFSKKEKVEKISIVIYITLSLFWNTLSVLLVLFVAKLNHTFVECLFILTSFWLSKRSFGKPFHLSSMAHCFIVSNLTYYGLNRITTPLGISILVPIMLGVGLSYVTSKLVKKIYKPLYKGMPKEIFDETILQMVDKDSDKYKICYDYYINKKSALYLANKYNYSEAGIRKITNVINNKIKELK